MRVPRIIESELADDRPSDEKLGGTYLVPTYGFIYLRLYLYLYYLPFDTHTVPGLGARLAIITNEAVGCAPASEQLYLSGR